METSKQPHSGRAASQPSAVLKNYLERLQASVRRSGLLQAFPTRSAKRIDLDRLKVVYPRLPSELVTKLIRRDNAAVQFELEIADDEEKDAHAQLYEALASNLARTADAFRKETGTRSLWLAYPLFHCVTEDAFGASKSILAPVFLWPVKIEAPLSTQGRIIISRDEEAGGPKYNKTLDLWITENLGFNPDDPELDDFAETSSEDLERVITKLYAGLSKPPPVSLRGSPTAIPDKNTLEKDPNPKVLNSGILGLIQWENQALTRDLEMLFDRDIGGVAKDFLQGRGFESTALPIAPPEKDRYYVTPTDPSQERAVWLSRTGSGLVVHGPPGTGKSQTIVNMVADALAHGERVLVVCQKKAAIDVVANRLKGSGLGELFALIHDSESDRSRTILSIKDHLGQVRKRDADIASVTKRLRISDEIEKLEQQLTEYGAAICSKGDFGLPYRDLLAKCTKVYQSNASGRANEHLKPVFVGKNIDDLDELEREICNAGRFWDNAEPESNVWRFRKKDISIDPIFKSDLEAVLGNIAHENQLHVEVIRQNAGGGIRIQGPVPEFQANGPQWQSTVCEALQQHHFEASAHWIRVASQHGATLITESLLQIEDSLKSARKAVESTQKPADFNRFGRLEILAAHANHTKVLALLELETKWWRVFSGQYHKLRKEISEFLQQEFPPSRYQLEDLKLFLSHWIIAEAWSMTFAKEVINAQSSEPFFAQVAQNFAANNATAIAAVLEELHRAIQRAPSAGKVLHAIEGLSVWLQSDYIETLANHVRSGSDVAGDLSAIRHGLSGLEDLQILDSSREIRSGLAKEVLEILERSEGLPNKTKFAQRWWATVRCSAYVSWKEQHENRWPVLKRMNGRTYDDARKTLAKRLKDKRELEAASICELWREKQSSVRKTDFNGILVTRGPNSKRLRQVVELGGPIGLFDFRPCWLTNPNTASQIFPLHDGIFDLVIFDEASQCPVEQAIPAIYRAKRVVVAGDEKQLPPTAFFQTQFSFGDGEVEETEVSPENVQDQIRATQQQQALFVKDLLDASKNLLRECLLNVHYRSEHPDLIDFSNHAFYGGELQVPPPTQKPNGGATPLVFIEAHGIYHNKKNVPEAERVVALLKELWMRSEGSPTIGVVTFNEVQRDLIEDILVREASNDEQLQIRYLAERNRMDGEQDVGFFVKNLESVQGDERDVMIFSTTFGRDETGRFLRAFGPINMDGGERRLNVAITRAKKQNFIVTSMPIAEISDKLASGGLQVGATAGGREFLHAYMQYVKAVSSGQHEVKKQVITLLGQITSRSKSLVPGPTEDSPFEVEVRDAITKLGYKTEIQVGESGFRIDIAVVSNKPEEGFILGIECDGKSYHSEWTARARDVWRQEILERRGWKIHRIWSTDWWLDREGEIRKLQAQLRSLG